MGHHLADGVDLLVAATSLHIETCCQDGIDDVLVSIVHVSNFSIFLGLL